MSFLFHFYILEFKVALQLKDLNLRVLHNETHMRVSILNIEVVSHYYCPIREVVGLSGQTLLRVQINGLKIANKIY
jgi:hypothetical protein